MTNPFEQINNDDFFDFNDVEERPSLEYLKAGEHNVVIIKAEKVRDKYTNEQKVKIVFVNNQGVHTEFFNVFNSDVDKQKKARNKLATIFLTAVEKKQGSLAELEGKRITLVLTENISNDKTYINFYYCKKSL